jgi:hypothetical protein
MQGFLQVVKPVLAACTFSVLMILPSGTTAQIDAGKAEAARKAASQFSALSAGSEKSGKPPRDNDPKIKGLLDVVYDTRDIDKTKSVPAQGLQSLSQRMATGTQVALVYMLAGTGLTDLSQAANDPAVGDRVNLNTIEFAPEMGRYFDFQLKVQGGVIDAVANRIATAKPEDLKRMEAGIAEIRAGSQRTVSGVIETLALNGLTEEWRKERMPALLAVAPKLTKFLQPPQKEQLRALSVECANVMDDASVKKDLLTFAQLIAAP